MPRLLRSSLAHITSSRTSTRKEARQKQALMDVEIDKQQQQLIQLRRERNSLSPLLNLSVDIVVRILELLSSDEGGFDDDPEPEGCHTEREWLARKPYYHWVPATQFCSLWRDVALGCPQLWTRIECRSMGWAKEFIDRSKQRLVDVDARTDFKYVYSDTYNWSEFSLKAENESVVFNFQSLILEQANRIHTLYACRNFDFSDISSLPQLEMMTLSDWFERPRDSDKMTDDQLDWEKYRELRDDTPQLYSPTLLASLPKLLWLKLHNCKLFTTAYKWRNETILSALTHLSLHLSPVSELDHLQVKEHCPNLQYLCLSADPDDFFRHASKEGGSPTSLAPISLQSLRHLEFNFVPWAYIKRIGVPNTAGSFLQIAYQVDEKVKTKEIIRILDPLLSTSDTRPDYLTLDIEPHGTRHVKVDIVGSHSDDENPTFCLRIVDWYREKMYSTRQIIYDMEQEFGTSYGLNISKVYIQLPDSCRYYAALLESEAILNNPNVAHLVIQGDASVEKIFRRLRARHDVQCSCLTSRPDEENDSGAEWCCKYQDMFPALETLEIIGVNFKQITDERKNDFLDFVSWKGEGCDIVLVDCDNMTEEFVEGLEVYVGSVVVC